MQAIQEWLRGIGLDEYAARFAENGIDLSTLPDLTEEDLKELGVLLGHRRKLLRAIATLGARPAVPDAAQTERLAPAPAAILRPPSDTAGPAGERRYLTVMFCDLVGSTEIASRLDAEEWRDLVGAYLDTASAAVTGMGGHVAKKLGDGLMALFGYPVAQENDPERAARAALAIQHALAELNLKNAADRKPPLAARIGLEAGQVVVDATGEIFGDAPNVAARVQAIAEPGTVLVTSRVQRQVAGLFVAEDRGCHELKGVPEPQTLFRLVRASGGGRRAGQRQFTSMVGRDEEIATLLRRWEQARQGGGQLVMVVGEPGLGKSRLIEELHARLSDTPHTWVEWSCSQLLQNTPLHPIGEWGRQRFGGLEVPSDQRFADLENTLAQVKLDPAMNAALLAPLLDIPLPDSRAPALPPEELRRRQLAAVLDWLLAGAKTQPIVLAAEDLQWADPTTIELLRSVAERGSQAPLLVVATARPEFRPPWGMRSHHGAVSLAPLDPGQVRAMVTELSARHALPGDVVDDVTARTGGVPLFVEELTRLLLERGAQGGAHTIPPTLQQSLAARLDRLGPAREVAQIGSVLGRDFSYALLRATVEIDDLALQAALERLADADILLAQGSLPQSHYRFKHALIQDAAYENLLKSRRQVLHGRVAETLRDRFADTAAAEPEVLAYHFTQARETEEAIEWWGKAGDQALRRSAFQEAISHLGKAIEMADTAAGDASTPSVKSTTASASQRLKLQTSLGRAMMWSRGFGSDESVTAFARARTLATGVDNASERFDAYNGLFTGSLLRGELGLARETAESFLREAENAGRTTVASVARRCVGHVRLNQGDFVDARSNLIEALRTYDPERERDDRLWFVQDNGAVATGFLTQATWALGDIERARALGDEALARADETAKATTRATVYHHISLYHMLRGDPEAVRRTAKVLVDVSREHGMALYLVYGEVYSTWACARLGDRETGVSELRRSLAAYVDQGNKLHAPLFQGLLAELEAEGDGAEGALRRIDEALALANETGGRWTEALLHRIRGAILLKRDPTNPGAAEEAFLTAIAIAQAQKARAFEPRAALALAKLYQSTGRPAEAQAVLAPALEGFAPTPQMPEIGEAQVLLAALADTAEVRAEAARHTPRL